MKKKIIFILSLLVITAFCTCKKDSTSNPSAVTVQGNVTLTLTIMHHWWNVSSIPVYLKFNATQFPGKDSTMYDVMKAANREGIVSFSNLGPGDLIVYAAGFDSVFQANVWGYSRLKITKENANSTVNAIVNVSE